MKSKNRGPALCQAFVLKAKNILADHPNIVHTWSIDDDGNHCILDFPKQSEDGFDIVVEVFPHEITVMTEAPHIHFPTSNSIGSTVESVLGLLRDLLSPATRVRELSSNGRAYRWYIESLRNGMWQEEESMGLLFYNYIGKKTEKVYCNRVLLSRI